MHLSALQYPLSLLVLATVVRASIFHYATCTEWKDPYHVGMETADCKLISGASQKNVYDDKYRYWCYTGNDITIDASFEPYNLDESDYGSMIIHYHNHVSGDATDMKVMVQCANKDGVKLVSRIWDCWSKAHSMQRMSRASKTTQVGGYMEERCVASEQHPIKVVQVTKWW